MAIPLSPDFVESLPSMSDIRNVNELRRNMQTCAKTQFTGRLDLCVEGERYLQSSLFFCSGRLIGADSNLHAVRRWCRQLSQHCPQLAAEQKGLQQSGYWDQDALVELVQQGNLSKNQLTAVVEGNLVEILFDVTQLLMQRHCRLQLTHRPIAQNLLPAPTVEILADRAWHQAAQAWQSWQQAGLSNWSPNWSPVIWDAEALRQQTSLLAYHNLTKLVDGDRTLRDIAVRLQQPIALLTQSLLPYIQSRIMGLISAGDFVCDQRAEAIDADQPTLPPVAAVAVRSPSPLIAYIEDSRMDSMIMSQILAQSGCRSINVRDPLQALPILLEHKPNLIFLDLLMPVTNGYEVCAQIRRVSALKETPVIIVTSSDGIVDRVRAKLAGSTGFIAKPIQPEKVQTVLRTYLIKSR